MRTGKPFLERTRKAPSRRLYLTVSLSLGLAISLTLSPQITLAESADLPSDLSDVFAIDENEQAVPTDQNPDQPAAGATQNAQTVADTAATDTRTDGAESASAASEPSAPPSTEKTPDVKMPPSGSAPSQSAAPVTPAGGADVAGRAGATTEATSGAPQTGSTAGQTLPEGSAALPLATPATTGNSRDADHPGQADNTRAAAQVWDERTGIVTPGTAGRVVHVFGASIPTLVCQPGMVCLLELEAGEEVLDTPVQADPARWLVELRHRDAPVSQTYFAFKPSEDAAARTNFVVLTDRRVYVVNLVKDLLRSTYILSFDYPDTRARTMAAEIEARAAAKRAAQAAHTARRTRAIARTGVSTTRGAVPASDLDFNYHIRGNAPFKPLRVYNDGRKTYVDLPTRYRGDLPVVIGGAGEDNRAFNYRVARDGTQFIIDRVLQDGRRSIRIRRGS